MISIKVSGVVPAPSVPQGAYLGLGAFSILLVAASAWVAADSGDPSLWAVFAGITLIVGASIGSAVSTHVGRAGCIRLTRRRGCWAALACGCSHSASPGLCLTEGRGHAISLLGNPVGGLLYGAAAALPLVADLASFSVSAALSARIKQPMLPSTSGSAHPRFRHDLLVGLRFLWSVPLLRSTLLATAFYQFVFVGTVFALIAHLTATGVSASSLGVMFAVAAVGGILGATAAPALQSRLQLKTMVLIMGWTATAVFAILSVGPHPIIVGALIGCTYFTSAPANAVLLAAQIQLIPTHLQGRVIAAAYLISGLIAPLGTPGGGILLDITGPATTFAVFAVATAVITIAVHLNRAMRDSPGIERGS